MEVRKQLLILAVFLVWLSPGFARKEAGRIGVAALEAGLVGSRSCFLQDVMQEGVTSGGSEHLTPAGEYSERSLKNARKVIAVRDYGILPDTGKDIVPTLLAVLDGLRGSTGQVELRFEEGRYDIFAPSSDAPFSYALKIEGFQNLSIDGGGASFVCHGPMRVMTFVGCRNVLLRDMSFDWERPLVSQGMIIRQGQDFLDVSFDKSAYPFRIVDGKILFYGDGWESEVVPDSYSTLYSPDGHIFPMTEDMYLSAGNSLFRGRAEEISPGVVRFYGVCVSSLPMDVTSVPSQMLFTSIYAAEK